MAGANPRVLPLSRELRALGRAIWHPAPLVLVFVIALLGVGLAYQQRFSYTLQAGSRTDLAFWNRVNGSEQDPASKATFRWTTPSTVLTLPGVGADDYRVRLDLSGARPSGFAPPDLVIRSGATELAHLQPAPGRQVYEVTVPAAAVATANGDLVLTLQTLNPFSPPGDPRQLGVVVYGVQVDSVGQGLVLPPWSLWLLLSLSAVLLALLLALAGWGPDVQRLGGLAWVLGAIAFLMFNRLWLTPMPAVLIEVLLFAGIALLLFGPLWRLLYRGGGIAWPEADQRWLLAIYALAFVARLAGQLHPQTVIIDLIFHAHRFEQVLGGQLLFTIKSDEWGGHETFYLPTPYVFMLPLQWLLNDELLTIRLFGVALDTLGVFLVYYLARRAFRDGRAGLLAAGLQVTFPLAVLPFSWGITANLFGQFVGLAALAIVVGCYERLTRPGPWLLLVGFLILALLSHPGSVQLTGVLFGGLILVWGIQAVGGAPRRRAVLGLSAAQVSTAAQTLPRGLLRSWLALVAALLVATAIAWFGYYAHFAEFELHEYQALQQERAAARASQGFSVFVGGEVADKSLGLLPHAVHSRSAQIIEGVQGFAAEAWAYFGAWPLLWAVLGLYAVRRPAHVTGPPDPVRRRMLWTAAVWVAVVLLYAVVGLVLNLYVRYALFGLPLVALGGGLLLSALSRRGRWAGWLVTLVMLAVTVDALIFWYMRITFANK